MKGYKKWVLIPAAVVIVPAILVMIALPHLNSYQENGILSIRGLKEEVKVLRDEKGMAYIYARNIEDALMAHGFVTAQDRLFQMELTKLYATGRISEWVGEKGEPVDIRMRTIGFHRQGKKQAEILDPRTRLFFQKYLDGVNFYIQNCPGEHPLEFRLAGIKPTLWDLSDSLAILFFMSWNSAANLETEIIAQMLVEKIGFEKAKEIFPININPDDPPPEPGQSEIFRRDLFPGHFLSDPMLLAFLADRPLRIGSNNWAAGPAHSSGGKPIVANDPHLDARLLPGPWYPCGWITQELRMVGAGIPGIPGFIIGRNEHVAIGVTNAYGDAQDLYVETLDPKSPDRYLEGQRSIPFEILTEKLTIKDKGAPSGKREKEIKIRLTRRGPVISGVLPGLATNHTVTLRWAPFETMAPSLGFDEVIAARSVEDLHNVLRRVNIIMLNFVFADRGGNIGWAASGKLPIRSQGDSTTPFVVKDSNDNWIGWIPAEKMPRMTNPARGWVGTCNHKTVKRDYPYYYSSHLSPSYRYRRLIQLLDRPGKKTADDHWQFQRDTLNLMAQDVAPVMAKALKSFADTKELGEILTTWDFRDEPEKPAPLIFQAVYSEFALLVFRDKLGETLAHLLLGNWYFWQERLQLLVRGGDSPWFYSGLTQNPSAKRDELFHQAGLLAFRKISQTLGPDPQKWEWGKVHRLEFLSPILREGLGKGWLGAGSHPMAGSGETLYRAIYDFVNPFQVTTSASLRMVADLSDDEKICAVLPGGVSGRLFHPHYKDQTPAFLNGGKLYWWFGDKAIHEHQRSALFLQPK